MSRPVVLTVEVALFAIVNALSADPVGKVKSCCQSEFPGDFNGDAYVDLNDFSQYLDCSSGPGAEIPPECSPGDTDEDGDVDFADLRVIQQEFTGPPPEPALPDCDVSVFPGITMSLDDGETFLPYAGPPVEGYFITLGLTALDLPNTFVAESGNQIVLSRDSGCTWSTLQLLTGFQEAPLWLTPAGGGNAYAWHLNDRTLYEIHNWGQTIQAIERTVPVFFPSSIMGVGPDPADPRHVRLGEKTGQLHESFDAGASWRPIGVLPPVSAPTAYYTEFDAADIDHIVHGRLLDGAFVSFDGGDSWTASEGFSLTGGGAHTMSIAISPVNGDIVWAMGIDVDEAAGGAPSLGKHIFVSTDGGLHFERVVDNSGVVHLTNGIGLFPHPADANRVYFVFGSLVDPVSFGTDLYRYDLATDQVRVQHYDSINGSTLTFSPLDPTVLYLGLEGFGPP